MRILQNVKVGGGRSGTGYAIRNGEKVFRSGGAFSENFGKCKGGGGLYPERGTQSGTRGGTIRNGVRNPERGERVGGWRCFFVRIFENVRVEGGGGVIRNGVRNPERGGGRGVAVLFLRTLENVRGGGGARSGTGYAIRNGGKG